MIEVLGLTKQYGKKTAIKNVSFSVQKGQIYGFLGPNGAGKSTIIKMLTGLVFPTSGGGTVLGKPLGNVEARKKMGYLPELFRFQEWMTANDLLNFQSGLYGLKKDPARNKRILARVGLTGQENYKIGSYSKGMQQRIGIGCALLCEPELLFLDEPTSALDPVGRKDVRDIILSLKNEGVTVFLNSHLLSEVEAVCDSITIINNGVLVKSGDMKELLEEKLTLSVQADVLAEEDITYLQKLGRISEIKEGSLTMNIKNRDAVPPIADYFVSKGRKLYELTTHQETLESLFLEVVGEGGSK
jgi:ABC-type multidrug transport system, ATPase component